MSRIIFDIETLGFPLESFDEESQSYLLKFADTEEKVEEVKKNLNLHAMTAQVLCIALVNPESKRGRVFFQSDQNDEFTTEDGNCLCTSGSEKEILEKFWEVIPSYEQFVTFNGRSFDCPFIMLRSALLNIQPTRNLLPYRYSSEPHCDLLEQLTFYQTTRRFSLDFYCKQFGIESPKSKGITGLDMKMLFESKRFKDIALYCYGDVLATAKLFEQWHRYIRISE